MNGIDMTCEKVTPAEVGEALKAALTRMKTNCNTAYPLCHCCQTCNHLKCETSIDNWGVEKAWHNWCGLDKSYMDITLGEGNGKHFSEPCEYWEWRGDKTSCST